jgi:calreticulin
MMSKLFLVALSACLVASASVSATIFFQEKFDDGKAWKSRWVESDRSGLGLWDVTTGEFYGDAEADVGLHTTQDAKFYAISAAFDSFSNKDSTLVVQFSVKHQQDIDCGGAYVKLFPAGFDQTTMDGDSVYNIMFGPDICGHSRRTHVIVNYEGENQLVRDDVPCESDVYTHVYTLIVNPDQTYEVKIDGVSKRKGSLVEDFDFLEPQEIKDPSISKPADWVDVAKIEDPDDVKPAGWDDVPATIEDPEAVKPDDWDDEDDGEWEAPTIDNPEYKGEWKAKQIANPEYKGEWVHPLIPNPAYKEDDSIYAFESFGAIGFDLWQVKAGTVFDNIVIADSEEDTKPFLAEFKANRAAEKAMLEEQTAAAAAEDEEEEDDYDIYDDDEEELHSEL